MSHRGPPPPPQSLRWAIKQRTCCISGISLTCGSLFLFRNTFAADFENVAEKEGAVVAPPGCPTPVVLGTGPPRVVVPGLPGFRTEL